MAKSSFDILLEAFNKQIEIINNSNMKIYDADNQEYYIDKIEYCKEDDKLIFTTIEDPEECERMYYDNEEEE